jgi:Zn finger protein HypA/HybF involved in hydrogenase expression
MLHKLKRAFMLILDPPWTKEEGPETFTMAVPQSHSTFKRGDVGWPKRPPAVVECPSCSTRFTHEFANDYIDCPDCHYERPPDEFADLDLVTLACPHCELALDYGTRHPDMMDVPEWASCTECQYHWEYQHDYDS